MSKNRETPQIAFPEGWKKQVRSAVLHVTCRIKKENGIMKRYVWCNLIVMLTATAAPENARIGWSGRPFDWKPRTGGSESPR